jgi:hypothetical protein
LLVGLATGLLARRAARSSQRRGRWTAELLVIGAFLAAHVGLVNPAHVLAVIARCSRQRSG